MSFNIKNSGNAALGIAGKILPPVAGVLSFLHEPLSAGADLNSIGNYVWNSLRSWSFPDLGKLISDFTSDGALMAGGITAIAVPIAQKFIKDMGVELPSTINTTASIIKRTAASTFGGRAAAQLLWKQGGQAVAATASTGGLAAVQDLGY